MKFFRQISLPSHRKLSSAGLHLIGADTRSHPQLGSNHEVDKLSKSLRQRQSSGETIQELTDSLHMSLTTLENNHVNQSRPQEANGKDHLGSNQDGKGHHGSNPDGISSGEKDLVDAKADLSRQLQQLKSVFTREILQRPVSSESLNGSKQSTRKISREEKRWQRKISKEEKERKISKEEWRRSRESHLSAPETTGSLDAPDVKGHATDQQIEFAINLMQSRILLDLLKSIGHIDFEDKKVLCLIFKNVLQLQNGADDFVTADYIRQNPEILATLLSSYRYCQSDITLNCGEMLRDCLAFAPLAEVLFERYSEELYNLFAYVRAPVFDVSMDAFCTLQTILTSHRDLSARFLRQNFDVFFSYLRELLESDDYVIKRQSLEILIAVLDVDRSEEEGSVRSQFVADVENLKLVCDLLTHKWKQIQLRSLRVFELFLVAKSKSELPSEVTAYLEEVIQTLIPVLELLKSKSTAPDFREHNRLVSRIICDLKLLGKK